MREKADNPTLGRINNNKPQTENIFEWMERHGIALDMLPLVEAEDIWVPPGEVEDWRTSNGAKFPIKEGQTTKEAAREFLDEKNDNTPRETGEPPKTEKHVKEVFTKQEKLLAPDRKFVGYALNKNHPSGGTKARKIEKELGYTTENYKLFQKEILEKAPLYKSYYRGENKQGDSIYYTILPIKGLKGTPLNIHVGWVFRPECDKMQIATIIPKTRREPELW